MENNIRVPKKILEVENLSVVFPGPPEFHALTAVSFSLYAGKTLAVVGHSGSGKSLTALALMGLLPSQAKVSGRITLKASQLDKNRLKEDFPTRGRLSQQHPHAHFPHADDSDVELLALTDHRDIRGKRIAMIFQEPMSALNPLQKVGVQIREAILRHQRISKLVARRLAVDWLEKVHLPEPASIYHRYPHQLSGGQKQRVMIAMAMCNHPDILLADEPTTALDVTVQQEIIQLMQQLQQEMQTAMLFITHDQALASRIADDFLIMEAGKMITDRVVTPLPEFPEAETKRRDIPLLQLENVDIVYSRKQGIFGKERTAFKAVDQVSFALYPGQTVGLVGESGCGKSTLSKAIMGLLPIQSGNILLKGKALSGFNAAGWRQWRRHIQIILQDPYASLNPRMKVGAAIIEPLLAHRLADKVAARHKMKALLEAVELPLTAAGKYPHEFSGGQRQRISIARALTMDPELIICDESVSALDQKIQAQILELLWKLQQEKGLTYLFITHDINVLRSISDEMLVMKSGKIVEQGTTEQVITHPQEPYTKKLLEASVL